MNNNKLKKQKEKKKNNIYYFNKLCLNIFKKISFFENEKKQPTKNKPFHGKKIKKKKFLFFNYFYYN